MSGMDIDEGPRHALWEANPALVQLLGLCPLLAVSTSVVNALGLGLASVAVLTLTSSTISLLRPLIRPEIRLPLFVLVIATAVTAVEMLLRAYLPELHEAIGLFIALIVTNCLILGRAEAFAARRPLRQAAADGAWMGLGFAWVLLAIGAVRELLGHGTLFAGMDQLFGPAAATWRIEVGGGRGLLLALLPTGAFFALAGLVAIRHAAGTGRDGGARGAVADPAP